MMATNQPQTAGSGLKLWGTLWLTLFRLLVLGLRKLPFGALRFLSWPIGCVAYVLAVPGRRIAYQNLELVYGSRISKRKKRQIARRCFINLVNSIFEFAYAPAADKILNNCFDVKNDDLLRLAHEQGRGIVLIIPHMGSWELSARWLTQHFPVVHAVARVQKPAWLDQLISDMRKENGLHLIDNKDAVIPSLRAMRRGEMVLMLIDQHMGRGTVAVDFFGHTAMTSAAPALLALRTQCAVIVGCCYRTPEGKFGLTCSPPIATVDTGDRSSDLVTNTQNYVRVIEEFVDKYPADWMWMHRRWRGEDVSA